MAGLFNGFKFPPFTSRTLFSKKAHNKRNDALNALMDIKVRRSTRDHASLSDRDLIIEWNGGAAADASSLVLTPWHFVSMGDDYLVVHTWDGVTEGSDDIKIAKTPKLRHSITSETIDGITISYGTFDTSTQTRFADDGAGTTEYQQVTPRYLVGDVIYSVQCDTFVTVSGATAPLTDMDINVDGRAWAAVP